MTGKKHPEILAPAGSMESVEAAVISGADAVYLGGERFSARANARNFTDAEMAEAVRYCHLHGVKVHRALNTVVFDNEIHEMAEAAVYSAEIGVDALIIEDMGAADIIKSAVPDMPLHASTQMTVYSVRGAGEAIKRGFSRIVLARELPLDVIREISSLGAETEVFVHGALCMSLSGQCFMSAMIGSRSANRGRCAQCCRLPFSAREFSDEEHALSLKDLSYVCRLEELADAGVSSFKIEGRMKRAEYVNAAVSACRDALRGESPDMKTLRAVFSRDGFTDGYLSGKRGGGMFGYRGKDDVLAAKDVLPALRENYRSVKAIYPTRFAFSAAKGKSISLEASCEGVSVRAEGNVPDMAKSKALSAEYAAGQLEKLGGTVFYTDSVSCDIDGGIFVSASEINSLRREAVCALEEKITEKNTPVYNINRSYGTDFPKRDGSCSAPKIRIHIRSAVQAKAALKYGDFAVIPSDICLGINGGEDKDRILVCPPAFTLDEEKVFRELSELRDRGFGKLYCQNISHINMGRELSYEMTGSYRLNCANSYAAKAYTEMGLSEVTASFEMKLSDISALAERFPVSLIVYGRLPLMLTVNCPVRASSGCGKCSGKITDRTMREFPVVCGKDKEYSEILNCDILYMGDKLADINRYVCLDFLLSDENEADIKNIINNFSTNAPMKKGFTRGLYFRGVI